MNTLSRRVEIHEEGPREGFQIERACTRWPSAPRCRRAGRQRRAAGAGGLLRQPEARAADGRRGRAVRRHPQAARHALHRAVAQRGGLRPCAHGAAGPAPACSTPRVRTPSAARTTAAAPTPSSTSSATGSALPRGGPRDRSRLRDDRLRLQPEGEIDEARLETVLRRAHAAGRRGRGLPVLFWPTPWAGPIRMRCAVASTWCGRIAPGVRVGLHLHDTRGWHRLRLCGAGAGRGPVRRLGRRAWAAALRPCGGSASGNIATEDLVFLCHELGIDTGIDPRR